MPNFYTSPLLGGGGGSPGGGGSTVKAPSFPGVRRGPTDEYADVGKFNIDLTDIGGTMESNAESLSGFVAGLADLLEPIGNVGIEGGPNLGGVVGAATALPRFGLETANNALGWLGDRQLPYLGNDPTRTGAKFSEVPGKVLDIISLPGRAVERTIAGQRVEGAKGSPLGAAVTGVVQGNPLAIAIRAITEGKFGYDPSLPPDLQERLDAGESVDVIADEMVARGQGFSQNPAGNLYSQLTLDPLNFISLGTGAVPKAIATGAGKAGLVGDAARLVDGSYRHLTKGMSRAGALTAEKVLGKSTSGVLHSLGSRSYGDIRTGLGRLSPEYAAGFDESMALANTQMSLAYMARVMGDELTEGGYRVADIRPDALDAVRKEMRLRPDRVQREVEHLMDRVMSVTQFDNIANKQMWAASRLAAITGAGLDEAMTIVPKNPSRDFLRTVDFATYGRSGEDLNEVLRLVSSSPALAAEADKLIPRWRDLSIISHHTLTDVRAEDLERAAKAGDIDRLIEAIGRYDALFDLEHITEPSKIVSAVTERIGKIKDGLPKQVRPPAVDEGPLKGPLPDAISEWRQRWADAGYELGFGPEDGFKTFTDKDGNQIVMAPFVPFASEKMPVNLRNPLGRVYEQLIRGVDQDKIIFVSRRRMVEEGRKRGMTEAETRQFHRAVLNRAIELNITPRGVGGFGQLKEYDGILRDVVGPERFDEIRQRVDPTWLVMKSFENDLSVIGLTQKLSGIAKTQDPTGGVVAGITEVVYPALKFKFSPGFLMQERIESPFYNLMRGIDASRPTTTDIQELWGNLLRQNRELSIFDGGERYVRLQNESRARALMGPLTGLRSALTRHNVALSKERGRIGQIAADHGEEFRKAVQQLDPSLWQKMVRAYGTADPKAVARAYFEELTARDPDAIDQAIDAVKATLVSGGDEAIAPDFLALSDDAQRAALQPYLDQGYRLHGSAVDPATGAITDARGFFTSQDIPTALWYGTDKAGRKVAAGSGRGVYLVPPPRKAIDLADPAEVQRLIPTMRDDLARMGNATDPNVIRYREEIDGIEEALRTEPDRVYDFIATASSARAHASRATGGDGDLLERALAKSEGADAYLTRESGVPTAPRQPGQTELEWLSQNQERVPVTVYLERPPGIQNITQASQAANVAAGVARGGSRASGGAVKTFSDPDAETVWQAFRHSFDVVSRQAFKTHYFNPERGLLERSLNHPYLGLYPLSYMWGKVVPEFTRFLLARPFGLRAPLAGANATYRVQEAIISRIAADPEGFGAFLEDNEDALYFLQLMLPGTPTDAPANAAAWARHLSRDQLRNRKTDIPRYLRDLPGDTMSHLGIGRDVSSGIAALQDAGDLLSGLGDQTLDSQLTRAGASYDSLVLGTP